MRPAPMQAVLERLTQAATSGAPDPYRAIRWPEKLDARKWSLPPRLISLQGLATYEAMDDISRKRLAFLELVNFFSMNVHGERLLIAGLEQTGLQGESAVAAYLQVFRAEEQKHLACFERFCERYGDGVYRDRNLAFPSDWNPDEGVFVFFARVLVFEELVDQVNVTIAGSEDVHEVVRQINHAHHVEEVRHLAFGRTWLRHLIATAAPDWPTDGRQRIGSHLSAYRIALWRALFNLDVYRDAGLADAVGVRDEALQHLQSRQRCRDLFARSDRFLRELRLPIDPVPA